MATLYFDCSGGAAGDMILASLLALGAPRDVLDAGVSRLGLNAHVKTNDVKRNSIAAMLVNVDGGHHAHAQTPHSPHVSPNAA
ncbi:MAG: nickel insertion protein, partial [Spirochaetota bacterium]